MNGLSVLTERLQPLTDLRGVLTRLAEVRLQTRPIGPARGHRDLRLQCANQRDLTCPRLV